MSAMEKKPRKIVISVSPLIVLLAILVVAGLFLAGSLTQRRKHALTIDDTAVIVTKVRALGELTTACYYDEMVLTRSKPGALSTTPSAPWPGTVSGKTWTIIWS